MGAYYCYVNWDRKEYFSIGTGNLNNKYSGLGYTPAARAFGLLLVNPILRSRYSEPLLRHSIAGRWYRDQVTVEADEFGEWWWDHRQQEFTDVSADVLVMLCVWDKGYIKSLLDENESFWLEVTYLVVNMLLPEEIKAEIEPLLGPDYAGRYKRMAASDRYFVAPCPHLEETPRSRWFT